MVDHERNKLTRRTTLAATAAAGASIIALSRKAQSTRNAPIMVTPDRLNRGNGAEPDTLDPNKIQGNWENNIVCDMFLGLMTEDAAAMPIPGAAESFSTSPDGLVYTFKIRDHRWSDGAPVTAHDFVYSFRRIADPRTAAQYVPILYPIVNMQAAAEGKMPTDRIGVRALDDRTLEMRFAYQVPYLSQLLMHQTAMPIPAHVVEAYGDAWIDAEHMVSNGPYMLKEWVSNDHVQLVKNPYFYARDTVAIENVFYYPTQDESAAIKRFRGGEFDLLTDTLPPQQVDWLRRELPGEVRLAPFLLSQYVQFNLRAKPFDDVRVREALSLAIDREIICHKVMRGGETPAYSFVPPLPDYPGGPSLRFRSMRPDERTARARALLAQAGFGPRNPLAFDYNTMNSTVAKIVALALQEMWRQVGCEVRLVPSDSAIQYDLMRKRDFAVGWSGWVADYRDPKNYLFQFQSSTTDMNYGDYENPRYDGLVSRSDYVRDPAERTVMLEAAEQQLLDDVAIAPVFFGVTRNLVSTEVKGWVDNSINYHRSRWLRLDRRSRIV
ncbi:MAG: peptide ABC transporter substrate-binding protein [Alphaproteobacteria bacterium]|nr:peptide ABC transporter substrate-binding protein [Alphaproteobacteria bacterium]